MTPIANETNLLEYHRAEEEEWIGIPNAGWGKVIGERCKGGE
jgi:hypothetical protein